MNDVLIINSYVDSAQKEEVLYNALTQLKKLSVKIVMVSNSILSKKLLDLCDYYIFNNSNELLPESESPTSWFAQGDETVHLYNKGIGYAIIKNINLALNFAHNLKAKRFIFMEYDNVFHDEDLKLLSGMFNTLHQKKAVFCTFEQYIHGYETRIFGGDVQFFVDNIPLPTSYESWSATYPYSTHKETLEYIFPVLFSDYRDQIELIDKCNRAYFKNSQIDLFSINRESSIIYNLENPNRPLLFILGSNKTYTIQMNNQTVDTVYINGGEYKKLYFDISTEDVKVEVISDTQHNTYLVGKHNIEDYRKVGVTFKLI